MCECLYITAAASSNIGNNFMNLFYCAALSLLSIDLFQREINVCQLCDVCMYSYCTLHPFFPEQTTPRTKEKQFCTKSKRRQAKQKIIILISRNENRSSFNNKHRIHIRRVRFSFQFFCMFNILEKNRGKCWLSNYLAINIIHASCTKWIDEIYIKIYSHSLHSIP